MSSHLFKQNTGMDFFHLLCFLFVAKLDTKVCGWEKMPWLEQYSLCIQVFAVFSAQNRARACCLLSNLTSSGKRSSYCHEREGYYLKKWTIDEASTKRINQSLNSHRTFSRSADFTVFTGLVVRWAWIQYMFAHTVTSRDLFSGGRGVKR